MATRAVTELRDCRRQAIAAAQGLDTVALPAISPRQDLPDMGRPQRLRSQALDAHLPYAIIHNDCQIILQRCKFSTQPSKVEKMCASG